MYESKWLSGEQNYPEIIVFRQQNYLKQQVNFLNFLTQISYMKMMFLCFILFQTQKVGIEIWNRDFVYDLAHRCRWFVTSFRLHFPFRLSVSNVSIVTIDEELSWEAQVICKDVGLLWTQYIFSILVPTCYETRCFNTDAINLYLIEHLFFTWSIWRLIAYFARKASC